MKRPTLRWRRNCAVIATTLWLCSAFAPPTTTWAATTQDFDTAGAGTDFVAWNCVPEANGTVDHINGGGPPPEVLSGGPPGSVNFLRVAEDDVETSNTIAFKRTDKIAAKQIVAEWDLIT